MNFFRTIYLNTLLYVLRNNTLLIDIRMVDGTPVDGKVEYRIGAAVNSDKEQAVYGKWICYENI